MKYRLCAPYELRGWEKQPMVLIERKHHGFFGLKQNEFMTLLLCDGVTDIQNVLTPEMMDIIEKYEKEGIVHRVDDDQPIDETQKYIYYQNRYVNSVYWSVTGKCNCRCRHCFVDAPDGQFGELSTEEALNIIEQMNACGISSVDLSGGEPFVRKDLWILIDHMLKYNISIEQVYTNGCLVGESLLAEFEKRSIHPHFVVSFDGLGWHDWLRGVEGTEKKTLKAIRLLIERGYGVSVSMCVHRGNIGDLKANIEYLNGLGVTQVNICGITNTPLWEANNQGNMLSTKEYYEYTMQYIPEYFRSGIKIDVDLGGVIQLFGKPVNGKRYKLIHGDSEFIDNCEDCYLCSATRWNGYITPEGRLIPCMPMIWHEEQKKFPLISEIGLQKGLSDSYLINFVSKKVSDLIKENEECRNCQYLSKCRGGCRAGALDYGDIMGPDKDSCFYWQNGYPERIRKVVEEAVAKYCQKV